MDSQKADLWRLQSLLEFSWVKHVAIFQRIFLGIPCEPRIKIQDLFSPVPMECLALNLQVLHQKQQCLQVLLNLPTSFRKLKHQAELLVLHHV